MKRLFYIIILLASALSLHIDRADAQIVDAKSVSALVTCDLNLKLRNNEYVYDAQLSFLRYDKKLFPDGSYTVVLSLWDDPYCKMPYMGPFQVEDVSCLKFKNVKSLNQSIPFVLKYLDVTAHLGIHYRDYMQARMYWSLKIYRNSDKKCLVEIVPEIDSVTGQYNAFFDYKVLNIQMESLGSINWSDVQGKEESYDILHPTEDLAASDYSGEFIKVSYLPFGGNFLDELDDFVLKFSFYHGSDRKRPCMFYEFTQDFDRLGNHRLYYSKHQFSEAAYVKEKVEERSRPTNCIKRTRHDWLPFEVFIPHNIIAFADEELDKVRKGENDTISVFVDLYSKGDTLLNKGLNRVFWVRPPYKEEKTECGHFEQESVETVLSRERLSSTEVLVTYNLKLTCKKCGHVDIQNKLQRVEYEAATDSVCPPHCWEDYAEIVYDKMKKEYSPNKCSIKETIPYISYRTCLFCGKREDGAMQADVVVYPNTEAQDNPSCCSDIKYIEEIQETRKKVVGGEVLINKISTYALCESRHKKWLVGERTESEVIPCQHNMVFVEKRELRVKNLGLFDGHELEIRALYRCSKCGLEEYRYTTETCKHEPEKMYKECQRVSPRTVIFKGVPIKLHLAVNEKDGTAVYVAETETTQGLWTAIYPNNNRGWSRDGQYPATNVSFKDVQAFISVLNAQALEEGMPVRFHLPTVKEWKMAYEFAGGEDEGWLSQNSSGILHPVAQLPANDLHTYDMKGNVSEMCIDTANRLIDEEPKCFSAVIGNNYQEAINSWPTTGVRWMDLENGEATVGFRLFAEPVESANADNPSDIEVAVGEKAYNMGYHWTIRNVYQCKKCHHKYYGFKVGADTIGSKEPIGCSK